MNSPAHQLLNKELDNGWQVTEKVSKKDGESGSYFSVGYFVRKDSRIAFLKALDLMKLLDPTSGSDITQQIKLGNDAYIYERDILKKCADNKLSKVIKLHDSSQILINNFPVPYLIFELATSDVRKHSLLSSEVDTAWAFKTTHSIAVGLDQLHKNDISHQDLKPSNILILEDDTKKIGDFGRSVTKDCKLPHSKLSIAGGIAYAPPEGTYGYNHPDWKYRRLGCDAYQLGSMLVFLLTGMPLTPTIQQLLPEECRAGQWQGTYQEVLPYLINAFEQALVIIGNNITGEVKDDAISIVKELCHPDILKRGDPKRVRSNQNPFSMQVYVSKLNRLAKIIEYNLWNLSK